MAVAKASEIPTKSPAKARFSRDVEAGFSLWRDAMRWQRLVNAALKAVSMTHTQYLVLASLEQAGGDGRDDVSQREIARQAGLDEATTSNVVQALEGRGLVSREPPFEDYRSWGVMLTPAGVRSLRKAATLVEAASIEFRTGTAGAIVMGGRGAATPKRAARGR